MKKFVLVLLLVFISTMSMAIDTSYPFPFANGIQQTGNACTYARTVAIGDVLIASTGWFNVNLTPTVSDTLGTSYTQIAIFTTGGGSDADLAVYIGTAASAGSNTVTMSVAGASFQQTQCTQAYNVTTTTDVASVINTSNCTTCTTSSITTTVGQDLLFCFVAGFNNSGTLGSTGTWWQLGYTHGNDTTLLGWKLAGSAGAHSCTFANTNSRVTYALIALKASASFAVATTALPDAAIGSFYTYTLKGKGGTGSYTCSLTSGSFPTGLTLSGCTISGTPTAGSANSSLVFQLSDSTPNTASSGTLNLHLGASFSTLTLRQNLQNSSGSAVLASSPLAGNCLVVSGVGAPQSLNPRDTLGTVFKPFQSFTIAGPGTGIATMEVWAGKVPTTGADTVTTSGAWMFDVKEYTNCQGDFIDFADITSGSNVGNVTITSGTSTTLVPNTMIDATAEIFSNTAGLTTNAPLTLISAVNSGAGGFADGYQSTTTVTGYTEAFTKPAEPDGRWGIILTGLRPGATGTPPALAINHRSRWVY